MSIYLYTLAVSPVCGVADNTKETTKTMGVSLLDVQNRALKLCPAPYIIHDYVFWHCINPCVAGGTSNYLWADGSGGEWYIDVPVREYWSIVIIL